MNTSGRICIYPKDIARVTGKSERFGRKLLEKIRNDLSKHENHFVTIHEFCDYTGLLIEQVQPLILD
jgi:hypothetical protein